MKIKHLILMSFLTLFSGCEYSDSKTTTTTVSTTDTGSVNLLHTNTNQQAVVVAGETYKSSSTIGVQSDGTTAGTKAILDFNFDTPTVKDTVNMVYDSATAGSQTLLNQAVTTSSLITQTAQQEFNATWNYLKTTLK